MKKIVLAISTMMVGIAVANPAALKSHQDRLSYTMGYETGKAFKMHQVDVDPSTFSQGLTDSLTNKKAVISQAEMSKIMANFQRESMQHFEKKKKHLAQENKQMGEAFLKQNSKKPGVVTLKSGLQYKILKKGKGEKPASKDTVTIDYEGKLINGKVFDSSYSRHQSATFSVNGVVPGLSEGLQLMHAGATWMFYIPADLAYGAQGAPPMIGPNAVLIFKVHLISVHS